MTEQIERVDTPERADTANREPSGYDAARRPGAVAGVLGGRPDLRAGRRRLGRAPLRAGHVSVPIRATCTWATPRRS